VQTAPNRSYRPGKERDTDTTFDYFGARYYEAVSGRFTTVDPVLDIEQALVDPQRWNRYAYARNSPLAFVDPDGRQLYYVQSKEQAAQSAAFMQKAGEIRDAISVALGAQSANAQGPLAVLGRGLIDSASSAESVGRSPNDLRGSFF
jgi:RHS repeat-associated protein